MTRHPHNSMLAKKNMTLASIYKSVRPSIVAFVSKFAPAYDKTEPPPLFPSIIGTGFIVDSHGIVATNSHVVRAIANVPRPSDFPPDKWPVHAILFRITEAGQLEIPLEVAGVSQITKISAGKAYYGPKEGPDLGFVVLKVKGLVPLQIDDETEVEEGIEVATAGYPMGTDALTAPGWLHQLTPTLQKGIVSAVLPYPCSRPHGFSINIMTQGGASGSPVFSCTTGRILGVLYAGLDDFDETLDQKDLYRVPTAISYVVPSHYIAPTLESMKGNPDFKMPADAITIDEMLQRGTIINTLEEGREWKVWQEAKKPTDEDR